jgi:Phosphopantetheinyl transferase
MNYADICAKTTDKRYPSTDELDIPTLIDKIDVATFIANTKKENVTYFRKVLSMEEIRRADKFFKQEDKNLSIVAHGLKRMVLSKALTLPPGELAFGKKTLGKPFCLNTEDVFFSITHAGEWAAVTLSKRGEIGIDIEFNGDHDYQDIAQACFTKQQLAEYEATNFSSQYFIKRWTQKESASKAMGDGLFANFSTIEIDDEEGYSLTELNKKNTTL